MRNFNQFAKLSLVALALTAIAAPNALANGGAGALSGAGGVKVACATPATSTTQQTETSASVVEGIVGMKQYYDQPQISEDTTQDFGGGTDQIVAP